MKKSIQFIVFLVAMTIATSGFCQIRSGAYSISPFFGGFWFEGDQDLKHRPVHGLRFGYDFTKNLGAEAVFDYVYTKHTTTDSHAHVYNYRLEGLYHLMPNSKLVPFIAAGVGGMTVDYRDDTDRKHRATIDYGAGLKYFFTDWLALRGDVRHILAFDSVHNNLEYTLGLSFYFGGSKPAPVSRYDEPRAEPTPEPMAKEKVEEKVVIMASEPKVEEKVMVAAAEPKIIILAFEDVHFDFDQSTLKPEAQTILKRNIQLLKENPKAKVRIAGYTSASGTEAYNQKLSERRANAVKAYLVNEGVIASDRLSTIGYGETNPAMYEAAPKEIYSKAAKANMRVLFEIIVQ